MKRRRHGALLAALATAAAAYATETSADCTCRAFGRDFALGQSACLATPAGFRLATCGMVLNNTAWHFSPTPCLGAGVAERRHSAQSAPTPHRVGR